MTSLVAANGRLVKIDDILCTEDSGNNISVFRVTGLLQDTHHQPYAQGLIRDIHDSYGAGQYSTIHQPTADSWIHADTWLWTRSADTLRKFPKVPRRVSRRTKRVLGGMRTSKKLTRRNKPEQVTLRIVPSQPRRSGVRVVRPSVRVARPRIH